MMFILSCSFKVGKMELKDIKKHDICLIENQFDIQIISHVFETKGKVMFSDIWSSDGSIDNNWGLSITTPHTYRISRVICNVKHIKNKSIHNILKYCLSHYAEEFI